MASLNSIFNFLTSNILTRAELFVGLIILLGYILQRKNDKPKNESASSLTLDLNSGLPTLDMLGNRRITIEGSTGVLRYESENIKINTNKMVVSVCGRGLTVKCISAVDVVIEGFITGIDFIT